MNLQSKRTVDTCGISNKKMERRRSIPFTAI
jgi:hypothetical protein